MNQSQPKKHARLRESKEDPVEDGADRVAGRLLQVQREHGRQGHREREAELAVAPSPWVVIQQCQVKHEEQGEDRHDDHPVHPQR